MISNGGDGPIVCKYVLLLLMLRLPVLCCAVLILLLARRFQMAGTCRRGDDCRFR